MKIEDYNLTKIELKKYQKFYSAKKLGDREYSNFRSGDLSKFKLIHVKVKMIENKQKENGTTLLCGIHRLKSFQRDGGIYGSKEGIYFYHYSNLHIFGCDYSGLKTDLKFDSNGECLTIQVDRTNDLLSFIDDHNTKWSIQLSKVVGEDPFAFSFEMYQPNVEIQFQFLSYNNPKEFPKAGEKELFLDLNSSISPNSRKEKSSLF